MRIERQAQPARRWLLLFALASLLGSAPRALAQGTYSEDAIKAALLEKVVSFLEWVKPPPAERPLNLAVLGDDDLATALEHLFGQRPFAGRPLVLRRAVTPGQLAGADIVVVGPRAARELPTVLKACAREGVLVVGDGAGLAEAGAAVSFFRDGTRVRFDVRPSALKQAGIKASYKLLSLARIVGAP